MGSTLEEEKENMLPVQQWVIKPSPKKHDSFTLEDDSLSIASEVDAYQRFIAQSSLQSNVYSTASSDSGNNSDTHTTTPKKQGILRLATTPGTGQSVRFGKRLYDDGDESKMSNSTANSSTFTRSQAQDLSEDAIEMSLGFIRSPKKSQTPEKDESIYELEEDSIQVSLDASTSGQNSARHHTRFADSIDTIAMPSLEGYSNIEDISLDYPTREDTTMPALSRQTKTSVDSFEDISFNESFLQAEIELAKRCMEEEEDDRNQDRIDDPTSEATVLVRSQSEEEIENETTTLVQGTPMGANSTHGSEYLSTRSQASTHSPTSTVSEWNTPRSFRHSPVGSINDEVQEETTDASSNEARSMGNESPSAQRLQRRRSVRSVQPSPSPLFARLKSLTNTPIRRSPLSTVVLPPGAFSSDESSVTSVVLSDNEGRGHSIFSRSTCTSASSGAASTGGSPCSPSANSIINEIIRESEELDMVHSERSQVLLQWIQEAEEESEQMRRLLQTEKERTTAALQEAETAQRSLLQIKKDAIQVEEKRSQRLQEVEALAAKLNSQLMGRGNVGDESKEVAGSSSRLEREERVTELEREVLRQRNELERLIGAQEESQIESQQIQLQREVEEQRQEAKVEEMKKLYEDREQEREAAYHSLHMQLEAIENSREGKMGEEEEERIELHRQLIESRDEQRSLQDALISAQKQIGALQGEDYKDNEALERATNHMAHMQNQLDELQITLQASRKGEQSANEANEESREQYRVLALKLEDEKGQWSKRLEQMESENDNLLQSLAEAEEHRRAMEDDFLHKRDVALEESKAREEQALSLAEEMQGRLEKVEAKLEAMTTRTTMLEHEVGDRGLQLVKLKKAKERLEEDNLNYSIALSSKQQELSLLKRNTNRSQRNTPASAISAAPRLSVLGSRTSGAFARGPLSEIQATAYESENSLAPLHPGPTNVKTMRRKTMDLNTPTARPVSSNVRVAGSTARVVRKSLAMPPPPPSTVKLQRPIVDRQKSPEEGTKITGPPSRTSSQASHRSSTSIQTSLHTSDAPSRRSSSSSMTMQIRPSLSSSILASEGPMDISELQTDREASAVRQRLQERSRDLQRARVPASMPSRARNSVNAILT